MEFDRVHDSLFDEVFRAMRAGQAGALVYCPAFEPRVFMPLAEVLEDDMANPASDALQCLVALVSLAGESPDPLVRAASEALVQGIAKRHADWHADDALAHDLEHTPSRMPAYEHT